jgi:molybdopterin-guanine dinucleotide biosynthesis protein A
MGRDKALLPFGAGVLAQHVAARVQSAAGTAILVGNPDIYSHLGFPVVADTQSGAGPLGGIHAALSHTTADWNLVVACDMPNVTAGLLLEILSAAEQCAADAVFPTGPSGRAEPVCAAWHRRALPAVACALERGVRKVTGVLGDIAIHSLLIEEVSYFQNVNTPEEWAGYGAS